VSKFDPSGASPAMTAKITKKTVKARQLLNKTRTDKTEGSVESLERVKLRLLTRKPWKQIIDIKKAQRREREREK